MKGPSSVINLYKRAGETPLEALERFRSARPEYALVPMTYAGRLDPLAEGVLLVLAGEKRFDRASYLSLPKRYEFKILWGFATDSYDILGKAVAQSEAMPDTSETARALRGLSGRLELPYPPYSSRPLSGVPLFARARAGTLPEDNLPARIMTVHSIEIGEEETVSDEGLLRYIEGEIAKVKGDFRQEEIVSEWRRRLGEGSATRRVSAAAIECASGTYVRALANRAGEVLGVPALALKIVRTRVGEHSMAESIQV